MTNPTRDKLTGASSRPPRKFYPLKIWAYTQFGIPILIILALKYCHFDEAHQEEIKEKKHEIFSAQ